MYIRHLTNEQCVLCEEQLGMSQVAGAKPDRI